MRLASSMMVLLMAQDRTGAVNLLSKQEAHKLVGKSESRKTPYEVRPLEHRIMQAESAADQKNKMAGALVCLRLQEICELFGAQLLSAFIKSHELIIIAEPLQDGFRFFFP